MEINIAQVHNIISIIAFSLSVVFLGVAIFLWFKFGILKIIGDLSGITARKSIEKMRASNENSGKKSFRPTPVAKSRGALTTKINETPSDESTNRAAEDDNATEILSYSSGGDTMLLDGKEAEINAKKQQSLKENDEFEMLVNMVIVHTREIIQ